MKTVLQLALVALVVHACVRAGESAWRHYQLEDKVEQEARYGDNKTASQLRKKIVQMARDYSVELEPDDIEIRVKPSETTIYFEYLEDIPLVPTVYTRPQTYAVSFSVQPMRQLVDDEKPR